MTAALIAFIAWSNNDVVRMSSLPCHRGLIFTTERQQVSLLVAGTSRTKQSVDPDWLTTQFSMFEQAEDGAVNLGRGWRGTGQLYWMIDDFVKHHDVSGAVALELSRFSNNQQIASGAARNPTRVPAYYNGYLPIYPAVVPTSAFLEDVSIDSDRSFIDRAFELLMLARVQLVSRLHLLANGQLLKPFTPVAKSPSRAKSCFQKLRHREKMLTQFKLSMEKKHQGGWQSRPNTFGDPFHPNNQRNVHYINKSRQLAEENGVPFFLFVVPRFYNGIIPDAEIERLEELYQTKIINPGADLMEKLYKVENYFDFSHMTKSGRQIYSNWLASQIRQHLSIAN